jgi:glucose 1-dehydrogenase
VQTIASTAPGAPITPLNRSWIDVPRRRVDVECHILLGRAAEAGEVAGVFAFLASDEAATAVDPTAFG